MSDAATFARLLEAQAEGRLILCGCKETYAHDRCRHGFLWDGWQFSHINPRGYVTEAEMAAAVARPQHQPVADTGTVRQSADAIISAVASESVRSEWEIEADRLAVRARARADREANLRKGTK